jgi:hypothetical protein
VESCTALVEHFDGRIEIIDWAKHTAALARRAAPPAALTAEPAAELEPA